MTLHHTVIEKDLALTREDFFAIAETYLANKNHTLTDDGFITEDGGKTLEATITETENTPTLSLHLSFTGHTNDEVLDLMVLIDHTFQGEG